LKDRSTDLLTFISFAGLFFLILLYIWAPNLNLDYEKPLIILAFILVCALGMMAASYPSQCLKLLNLKSDGLKSDGNKSKSAGHHPDCGKFQSHTLTFRNKKYCAGCSGLFLGASLGITLILVYYIILVYHIYGAGTPLYGAISSIIFWIGVVAVFLSLFQLNFLKIENSTIKFISNLVLVIGSTLILMGILEVKGNVAMAIYFLMLIGVWIYNRTAISRRDHDLICNACTELPSCPLMGH
jgi:hypothetical protein